MLIKTSLIALALLLVSCHILPPHHSTEVAFIRIYNQTDTDIAYQVDLGDEWTEPNPVAPQGIDFFYQYERKSKNETLPRNITQIQIKFDNCQLNLDRQTLENKMKQPTDKSAGWNLYITQSLIEKATC